MIKNLPVLWEDQDSIPGSGRSSGVGDGNPPPPPVRLPGESHGQRSLVATVQGGHKESDTTDRLTLSHFKLVLT